MYYSFLFFHSQAISKAILISWSTVGRERYYVYIGLLIVLQNGDVQQCKEIDLSEFAYSSNRTATVDASTDISVDTGERFADINYLLDSKGAATAVSLQDAQGMHALLVIE